MGSILRWFPPLNLAKKNTMKKIGILPVLGTTAALMGAAFANQSQSNSLDEPTGQLHINSSRIKEGGKALLSWSVTHPQELLDVVDIDPVTDTVVTTKKLIVKVSMIGTGVTSNNGTVQYKTWNSIKVGNEGWTEIFAGKGDDVDMSEVLYEREVPEGTEIKFAAYYDHWVYNNDRRVRTFKNGDYPPTVAASSSGAKSAEEYLQPFIVDGKLALGNLDYIYAAELTHTDTSSSGYDLQDSIVLVRFIDPETGAGSDRGEIQSYLNGGHSSNNHQ